MLIRVIKVHRSWKRSRMKIEKLQVSRIKERRVVAARDLKIGI